MAKSDLTSQAERTKKACARLALELSKNGALLRAIRHSINFLGLVLGVLALIVSLSQSIHSIIGSDIKNGIIIASGAMLIFASILDRAFKDHPNRFVDYSYYIGAYETTIGEILVDRDNDDDLRRLREVVRLAERNMNDIRVKWPKLYAKAMEGLF